MECLTLVFEQHLGVSDPCFNAWEDMVSFFVSGLCPKISKAIWTNVIGWKAKSVSEIMDIADHYSSSFKQKKEEKETKRMALQLHALENSPLLSET